MLKGGFADKLGNRYEAKWTISRLLLVLAGDYEHLTYEGINEDFKGFEFRLSDSQITQWHQTKINAPKGNWTIGALQRENLLKAFKDRLDADQNAQCHFISQDNAKSLRELANDARLANSPEEFVSALADGRISDFEKLKYTWDCDSNHAWQLLQGIYVKVIVESEIDTNITALSRLLLNVDGDTYAILRKHVEENLNKRVNRETLKNWINSEDGVEFKAWASPKSNIERIQAANERYLSTYIPFGIGGKTITRNQTEVICSDIIDSEGSKIVILAGVAGSGKSGAARQIIDTFNEAGIPTLAFRVDHYLDCRHPSEIGKAVLDINDSPVALLKALSPRETSVLIIDQLDAVSEVSGRNGVVKSGLFELLDEASQYGTVKVIIICRSYDLENDDRFRKLSNGYKTTKVDLPLLNWNEEIVPVLEALDYDCSQFSERQKRLLSVPVNLAVFIETGDKYFSFKNRADLFGKLIRKKEKVFVKLGFSWSLMTPLQKVAKWMSDRQELSAPESILDEFSGSGDFLSSENLIVISNRKINFFHESFFDYIYARSFISGEQSVLEMVLSGEQHLFRRTQVRQIFALMREADHSNYIQQLKGLLISQFVRYHLKLSIAQWLASLDDPSADELGVVLGLGNSELNSLQIVVLFSNANWFSLLHEQKIIEKTLHGSSEKNSRITLNWLSQIAGRHPSEIAKLIENWWAKDETKAEQLVDWFGFLRRNKPDDELLELCGQVIKFRPKNLFKDEGRDRIMMLLHTWVDHEPEKCGALVKELFDAWFEMHPDANLLDRDDFKLLDNHSLSELAKKSSRAFVEGTRDAILRTVRETVEQGEEGRRWYSLMSSMRSDYLHGFDGLFQLFEKSLCELSRTEPDFTRETLARLPASLHPRFMGLHLGIIGTSSDTFGDMLSSLLDDDNALKAGVDGAEWKPFAIACKAMLGVSNDLRDIIEAKIFSIDHEIQRAKRLWDLLKRGEANEWVDKNSVLRSLNFSGCREWNILHFIGIENLSEKGRRRYQQLSHKFNTEHIDEENSVRMIGVHSPIGAEQAQRMNDEQIISAMLKYDTDEGKDWRRGGAYELSSVITDQAKNDPNRYLALLLKLPLNINHLYHSGVLRGIRDAEAFDNEVARTAILHIHEHFKSKLSDEILSVIETHSSLILSDKIKELVFDYAVNGDSPSREDLREYSDDDSNNSKNKLLTVDDLVRSGGGGIMIQSVHGGRAKAWDTLKRIGWDHSSIHQEIWDLVETQAIDEKSVSIRARIFDAMTPLFNDDKKRYENACHTLFDQKTIGNRSIDPIAILATLHGVNMQKYIDFNMPKFASKCIHRMTTNDNKNVQAVGTWWLFCEHFRHGRSGIPLKAVDEMSDQEKILYADILSHAFHWDEVEKSAETDLIRMFNDPNIKIGEQASEVFRNCKPEDFHRCLKLAEAYIRTDAYLEASTYILYALDSAECDVMELVVFGAERLIASIIDKGDQHGSRGTGLYKLQELLAREYAASEKRQDIRKRILDLIDLMLENDIYGTEKITLANDR